MRFIIMDQSGHKQLDFNSKDVVELEAAKERFSELTEKEGYRAALSKGDGTHDLIKSFDESHENVIFIPHLRGG